MMMTGRRHFQIVVCVLLTLGCGYDGSKYERLFSGNRRILELSYSLEAKCLDSLEPLRAPFRVDTLTTISTNGFFSRAYNMSEFLGTHIVAPNFLIVGGRSSDRLNHRLFFAHAVVIDISDQCSKNADYLLRKDDLEIWEQVYRRVPEHALVFVNTGWGNRWGNAEQYFNRDRKGVKHYPGIAPEAAAFLLQERDIVGIGIDTASIDGGLVEDFAITKMLGKTGKYVLENVANLDRMPARNAEVVVAPIRIAGGSGGQARVFAILPE